jgi:hypothetical protein
MKKLIIACSLFATFFFNHTMAQDMLYVHKNGMVTHQIAIADIDSITFKLEPKSFITDADGNIYTTITIGTQTWLVENLKTKHFNNGDPIPTSSGPISDVTMVYQWAPSGNELNVSSYGRLYTWAVTTDPRGVAPIGYRVASASDWATLLDYLNKNGYSGFTFSLAGYRGYDGYFYLLGTGADFWTSTSTNDYQATIRYGGDIPHLISNGPKTDSHKTYGFSIRCIKN